MKQILYFALSFLLIAVMNLFVLGAHSSAMTMSSSHPMSDMNNVKVSVNCITLCTSVTSNTLRELEKIDKKDDTPKEPFYTAYQKPFEGLAVLHSAVARKVVKFEPPPGLAMYIQFAVFRT